MRVMPWRRWLLLFLLVCGPVGAQQNRAEDPAEGPVESQSEIEKGPVISQFRENWILGELRSLRQDMMEYRNDMNRIVTDRELEVADKAMGDATNTVTYFFYLIAGAASILALVGWSTIRDLKDNIRDLYDVAGPQGKSVAFVMTDAEVKRESFLEAINSMLATGEIPGLIAPADKDTFALQCKGLWQKDIGSKAVDPSNAIADDGPDLLFGAAELRAERGRETETHRACPT